jgi:hypothetical protein
MAPVNGRFTPSCGLVTRLDRVCRRATADRADRRVIAYVARENVLWGHAFEAVSVRKLRNLALMVLAPPLSLPRSYRSTRPCYLGLAQAVIALSSASGLTGFTTWS